MRTSHDNATPGSGSILNQVAMQHDDWGSLAIFQTDPDSAIGASGTGPYEVEHAFVRSVPSGGRQTLRRTYSLYPGDASAQYSYASTGGQHDGDLSRVTQVDYQIGLNPRVTVAKYAYLGLGGGVGDLVGTELPEPLRANDRETLRIARKTDGVEHRGGHPPCSVTSRASAPAASAAAGALTHPRADGASHTVTPRRRTGSRASCRGRRRSGGAC